MRVHVRMYDLYILMSMLEQFLIISDNENLVNKGKWGYQSLGVCR